MVDDFSKGGSPPADDIPPSVMAISNLRCPSPPPILTNSKRNSTTSPPMVAPTPHVGGAPGTAASAALGGPQVAKTGAAAKIGATPKPATPTLVEPSGAGGSASIAGGSGSGTTSTATGANTGTNTGTARPTIPSGAVLNDEKKALSPALDYVAHPPVPGVHHKAPSVHAHFYVDETKPKSVRSRSGSTSATGSEYSGPTLASKNLGSLEKLVASAASPVLTEQPNIDPRLPQDDGKLHVLLGACGALSAGKLKLIISKLLEIYGPDKISIQIILTKAAEKFISPETMSHLENVRKFRIWRDADEWTTWKSRTDPVLHIELRRWADILIVCPLTANTLSKICLGLCDNLLTNVIRAWNTSYPILLAPAMVSYTYNSIITKRHLRLLAEEMPWIEILKPVEKVVGSYGNIGMGGMMDHNEIVNKIVMKLGGYPDEDEDDDDKKDAAVEDDDDDDSDDDDDDDDDEAVEDDPEDAHKNEFVRQVTEGLQQAKVAP